jgi:hypothetical protein
MSCAGLVEIQRVSGPTFVDNIDSFQFIHLSAKEFLFSQMSKGIIDTPIEQSCLSGVTDSHSKAIMNMATRCLVVLSYGLPAQPLGGSSDADITKTALHDVFPFVGYATCFWIDHLHDTLSKACIRSEVYSKVLKALAKFLSLNRTLLAYIEASYTFKMAPQTERLDEWSKHLRLPNVAPQIEENFLTSVLDDTQELSRYLAVLHKEWGVHLLRSPKAVWEEATAFTTSKLIDQTGKTQVRTLIMDPPKVEAISSKYLSKISEMSEDGKTVAILSIWPSKYVCVPT